MSYIETTNKWLCCAQDVLPTLTRISGETAIVSADQNFNALMVMQLSSLQAQSVNFLMNSANGIGNGGSNFDWLAAINVDQNEKNFDKSVGFGLLANGRNLSLFDPESAYQMMSGINYRDSIYKAQFSELGEMKDELVFLQQAGQQLSKKLSDMPEDETIRTQLQEFIHKYNDWIQRFESSVEANGVLDGTQAAEISLYELEQSIENRFNGAALGLHGLKDLGIAIDPSTHQISINTTTLDAALTTNRRAVLSTLQEFSANFTRSAELLTSTGNFIPNRLDNLDRVIEFIRDNKTSLQAEFGLGDQASLSTQTRKALAAYDRMNRSGATT